MDFTENFKKHLSGGTDWESINRQYKANQPERNKKRLQILEQENQTLLSKGIVNKSLQGDIEHQKKNMNNFEFPSYYGLDVSTGIDGTVDTTTPKQDISPTPESKPKESFPAWQLLPDFQKLLGIPDAKANTPVTQTNS